MCLDPANLLLPSVFLDAGDEREGLVRSAAGARLPGARAEDAGEVLREIDDGGQEHWWQGSDMTGVS